MEWVRLLIRAKTATEPDYNIVFTLQLMIGCLIYAVYFFTAPLFARWYDNPLYSDLLRVSALSFIYRPFANLPSSILQRQMRFKAQTVVAITSLLVSSAASIGLAYLGYGVWSLIWGGIAGSAVNASLLIPSAKWRPRLSGNFSGGETLSVMVFLFPSTTSCSICADKSVSLYSRAPLGQPA